MHVKDESGNWKEIMTTPGCIGPVKPYTGGCVAIPKNCMETVMKNVREDCVVVIDSMETLNPDGWAGMGLEGAMVLSPAVPDPVPVIRQAARISVKQDYTFLSPDSQNVPPVTLRRSSIIKAVRMSRAPRR